MVVLAGEATLPCRAWMGCGHDGRTSWGRTSFLWVGAGSSNHCTIGSRGGVQSLRAYENVEEKEESYVSMVRAVGGCGCGRGGKEGAGAPRVVGERPYPRLAPPFYACLLTRRVWAAPTPALAQARQQLAQVSAEVVACVAGRGRPCGARRGLRLVDIISWHSPFPAQRLQRHLLLIQPTHLLHPRKHRHSQRTMSSFFGGGGGQQPGAASTQQLKMAKAEVKMYSDLFNK